MCKQGGSFLIERIIRPTLLMRYWGDLFKRNIEKVIAIEYFKAFGLAEASPSLF